MAGWFKRAQDLAQIGDLMAALERQSKDAIRLAQATRSVTSGHMFQLKENFRAKISEFEAVVALMDHRLDQLPEDKRELVTDKMSELEAPVLTKSVQSYVAFCARIQESGAVPLWAREVLGRDITAMEKERSQLAEPRFAGRIDSESANAIDRIKDSLVNLIEKAPRLPDFSAPDLGLAAAPAPGD
ncbi:MAG: hypothetical protein FJX52_02790 [Alphaproteobacteria bacterium]|nr:hypothetical protein [Alphaproteobacteria bacterium]